ncbi:MAG TPA: hypothetical protein IAA98_09700 [Candidatus Avipropionibacterium avicola]|uniref:Uncharacterized protein n=1 Tax=Candidatus Avipropionibacterium avicola TaxID=2840701 RepID=A0A9D1GXY9_9ACTN|nr:hypothetical protein [Candidatus Avipropionibacterium avicola]
MSTHRRPGPTRNGPRRKGARRNVGCLVALLLSVGVVVLAVVMIVVGVSYILRDRPSGPPPRPTPLCQVEIADQTTRITNDQAWWTSIIIGTSVKRGLPARAASIAMATVYQETDIRNLDHGDRDSVGLFQQRPSQGWGTVEQIMDPYYSTGKFYDALVKVDGWQDRDITEVAQEVQRSGFPDAYRQHETKARTLASAFTGWDTAAVRCLYDQVDGDAKALNSFLVKTLGITKAKRDGATLTYRVADERTAWIVAHLAVATGSRFGTESVRVADRSWQHTVDELGEWAELDEPLSKRRVVITVASE